jgi:hypothetical protein
MTDKSTLSKAFNTHLFEFIADITLVVPNNPDIKKAKTSLETLKRFNPSMIIKAWQNSVYLPYKEVIDDGDIHFFINKDYQQDLAGVDNSDDVIKTIDKLREPIREMTDENKTHCMKYITNLSKLSDTYARL